MDIDLGDEITKAMKEALKKRGQVNILIAGRSGVGKSTLINAVFQGQIASTGQGRPVTRETREYTKDDIPVAILDTRGLEMAKYKETLADLEELILARNSEMDPMRHIHVAWICVSEDSRRVEDGESQAAEMIAKHVPVLAIITKARSDSGFRNVVQSILHGARNVVRVRAIREQDDEGNILEPRGLVELVDATMEVVPDGHRSAFAAAQRVSYKQKRNRAQLIVVSSAAAAAGIGAIPIPFSDAALLVPVQVGMLAGITAAYGLQLSTSFLSGLLGSAVTALGATYAGRAIVSALLKLIPVGGSIAGGAIAATTASTLTVSFGELYIGVLDTLLKRTADKLPTEEEIANAFRDALRKKAKK